MRSTTLRKRIPFVPLLAVLLWTGCRTYMPQPAMLTRNHPVIGTWEYAADNLLYRREFTADGKCIMYRGRPGVDKDGKKIQYKDSGEALYVCDFFVVSGRSVVVYKVDRRKEKLPYEVLVDGRLNVEDRHIAWKVR